MHGLSVEIKYLATDGTINAVRLRNVTIGQEGNKERASDLEIF